MKKYFYLINVLLLGDSHSVGYYGQELDRLLRKEPQAVVSTIAVCGATPSWFFTAQKQSCGEFEKFSASLVPAKLSKTTRKVTDWLPLQKPHIVVVSLGTNFLNFNHQKKVEAEIDQMIQYIKSQNAKCIWVGPPDARKIYREKIELLAEVISRKVKSHCDWVDSLEYTEYPEEDKDPWNVHYTCSKGKSIAHEWAKAVADIVIEKSKEIQNARSK